jgi:hypothetical protein
MLPTVIAPGNGRWTITNEMTFIETLPLFLGSGIAPDAGELQAIGEGYSPFWLSGSEYGYIRVNGGAPRGRMAHQEIVLGRVGETAVRRLLFSADLEQFLPDTDGSNELVIVYAAPHPTDPDLLFVAVVERRSNRNQLHIFSIDLNSRLPMLRLQTDFDIYHSLGFSPDGRYLVVTGRGDSTTSSSDPAAILLLHDIENNETTPFLMRQPAFIISTAYDWSDDSRWLTFVLADNLVVVVAPDEHYARPLIHNQGECTSVAWLNE